MYEDANNIMKTFSKAGTKLKRANHRLVFFIHLSGFVAVLHSLQLKNQIISKFCVSSWLWSSFNSGGRSSFSSGLSFPCFSKSFNHVKVKSEKNPAFFLGLPGGIAKFTFSKFILQLELSGVLAKRNLCNCQSRNEISFAFC